MKRLTVTNLNKCGIKASDIAHKCKVSEAAVTTWKRKGFIPDRYHGTITRMVAYRAKTVNNFLKNINASN